MNDTKETNPKDAVGANKLAMHLVPSSLKLYAALAFTEGALKYGKYNWRVAGVRASIYLDAMERHLLKYTEGEWADAATGVPHLASVIACAGIILDADMHGKLTDDRPPSSHALAAQFDAAAAIVAELRQLHADKRPHQYTIEDTL